MGERFQVQGLTFTTHLSPSLNRALTSQGRVSLGESIFLTKNMWFFHQPSNSQHPTGLPLSIDFWYHICGVRAEGIGWGIKTALTSDASLVFLSYHVSDHVTETWNFHDSTSMLKNSIEPATKFRKLLITVLRLTYRKKLRNHEMEEIFHIWERWRWTEPPCLPEQSTLTSWPFLHTSWVLWANICGFLLRFHSIGICIESSASGDWPQSQCPPLAPEVQKVLTFKGFVDYFGQSCEYTGSRSENLGTWEKKTFQNFHNCWTINQDNIQIWKIKW